MVKEDGLYQIKKRKGNERGEFAGEEVTECLDYFLHIVAAQERSNEGGRLSFPSI